MNKFIIIGRIGVDATSLKVKDNYLFHISVATSSKWTDKEGEKQEKTEWHSVQYWSKSERIKQYLTKGKLLYLEGKITHRTLVVGDDKKYITNLTAETLNFL
jgi:single-strand DNA-binding protein